MAGLLNYQLSHSAVYYAPPKRIDVRRTMIGFAIAVVAVSIGAAVYAHFLPKLDSLYFRVGAVAVAATAVGLLGLVPVRYGRVRIPLVAAFIGALLSLIALYVMWLVWVHDALNWGGFPISYRVLLVHPIVFSQLIQSLNVWAPGPTEMTL